MHNNNYYSKISNNIIAWNEPSLSGVLSLLTHVLHYLVMTVALYRHADFPLNHRHHHPLAVLWLVQ